MSDHGDAMVRTEAMGCIEGIDHLQTVSGVEGLLARGCKLGDEPTWCEDFFWKKKGDKTRQSTEWHQNGEYRWLGDASKSQVFGVTLAYASLLLYGKPSESERKTAAEHFCRIVDRILDNDETIVDADTAATGYGNYSPKQFLGFGGIGPQLMLVNLKLASLLNDNNSSKYDYGQLYEERLAEGYLKFVERSRIDLPVLRSLSTSHGSEDNLAMLNTLLLDELNRFSGDNKAEVHDACVNGIAKRWQVVDSPENALFSIIYHGMLDRGGADTVQPSMLAMSSFSERNKNTHKVALKAKLGNRRQRLRASLLPKIKPIGEWPAEEYAWRWNPRRPASWSEGLDGNMQFTGIDYLLALSLGKYFSVIK